MYKRAEPTTPEERYGKLVNFLWTTEKGVYPLEILPTLVDLANQGIKYPKVLAITASGQILDWVASLYGRVGRVDFVDFKPGQNLYVAYKLANVCRCRTPQEFFGRLLNADTDGVVRDLNHAMMFFPELLRYPETYGIDVREVANFFVCRKDARGKDRFSQEFLTPYNLRHFFLEYEPWYRSLRDTAMRGVFHFYCDKIEGLSPATEEKYHVVYLSDTHAWADRGKLARNLSKLVAPGGWFQSAFFGSDCVGFIEYGRRDEEFRRVVEQLGEFDTYFPFNRRTERVKSQVRKMLRLNEKQSSELKDEVLGAFPEKQQVPFAVKRKY